MMTILLHYGGQSFELAQDRFEFERMLSDALQREESQAVHGLPILGVPLANQSMLFISVNSHLPIAIEDTGTPVQIGGQ